MPPEPQAGSRTTPWSGSMTLTMVWTIEGGGEELAVIVRALLGELREEIFVDAAEHVARGFAQRLRIESPHHVLQDIVLETLVVLRQLARERPEVVFHGFHGGGHGGAEIAILGHLQQNVIARCLGQHQGAAPGKIGFDQGAVRHLARGLVCFDRRQRRVIAVGRMPQEDEAQNGHEILVRREVRVGPHVIRNLPKVRLELFNAGQVVRYHLLLAFPVRLSFSLARTLSSALSRSLFLHRQRKQRR